VTVKKEIATRDVTVRAMAIKGNKKLRNWRASPDIVRRLHGLTDRVKSKLMGVARRRARTTVFLENKTEIQKKWHFKGT